MNAPPTPWKILAAISAPTDGAEPHNTDAMTVTISPNPSNCRFPKWSAKLPDNNKRAATASKYPVSVHWTALTLASRSRPIAGTASLTTLASKAHPRGERGRCDQRETTATTQLEKWPIYCRHRGRNGLSGAGRPGGYVARPGLCLRVPVTSVRLHTSKRRAPLGSWHPSTALVPAPCGGHR